MYGYGHLPHFSEVPALEYGSANAVCSPLKLIARAMKKTGEHGQQEYTYSTVRVHVHVVQFGSHTSCAKSPNYEAG